jgi:predicted O-methyltransferase YrrM
VKVPELYEQIRDADTDVRDHLPLFVDLVVDLDAVRVCELGVRGGISTIAWLMGLEQTNGRLWAIDINPAPFDHSRMTFVQGDDCDQAVIDQVPDDLDILFVDSSHLYSHTAMEIERWTPKVGDGGCIVFHDTAEERFDHHPDDEPPFPVRKAVEEAAHELGWQVDWYENCHGLAVCWPPSEDA